MKKLTTFILLTLAYISYTPHEEIYAIGFEENSYVYFNDIDNPVSIERIQSELFAYDPEDGDITGDIYVVLDNYTSNINKLGDYIIVFGVEDTNGLESTIAITVRNVDINAPVFVIDALSTLNIPQYSYLPSNMPQIKAIDEFEGDLTREILITGLEQIDTTILGDYDLVYRVSDSSGNITEETFTVSVVDSIAPELTGPNTIIKRADIILDSTFYLDYFYALDDHDGIVTNRIEVISDGYIGNASTPGTYKVVVSVKDTAGNYTNHNLTIVVVKDMLPRLVVDQYYWEIGNDYKLKDSDFTDVLKFLDDLPNLSFIFTTTYDNYSNNYGNIGTYQKNFHLRSSSGEEFTREIILNVVTADANIVEEDPGFVAENWKLGVGLIGAAFVVSIVVIGIFKSK